MNFKEWILNEMGDIASMDTSHIQFVNPTYGQYLYKFKYGNQNFNVIMQLQNDKLLGIGKIYRIDFSGPKHYDLTGTAGLGATSIYTQVLLAIKKLLESTEVNGLYFSPNAGAMRVIYKRFFDKYLGRDFTQVDKNNYIRKDVLRRNTASMGDEERKNIYTSILHQKRYANQIIKNAKQSRKLNALAKKFVHSFIYFDNANGTKNLAYLADVNGDSAIVYIDDKHPYRLEMELNDRLIFQKPTDEEIHNTMKRFVKSKDISLMMQTQEGSKLRQAIRDIGIHGQEVAEVEKRLGNFAYLKSNHLVYLIKIDGWEVEYLEPDTYNGETDLYINKTPIEDVNLDYTPSDKDVVEQLKIFANPTVNSNVYRWMRKAINAEPLRQLMQKYGVQLK